MSGIFTLRSNPVFVDIKDSHITKEAFYFISVFVVKIVNKEQIHNPWSSFALKIEFNHLKLTHLIFAFLAKTSG